MNKLELVGRIEIPPTVRDHRFFIEAQANAMLLQDLADPKKDVVGTWNTKQCELYGWAPNVTPHRDNLGWMYALLLDEGASYIHARPKRLATSGPHITIEVREGDVFRLDDFAEHWTEGVKGRVAAFVGVFETPCDDDAMAILREGIAKLARGDYYGAPRVRGGFRALLPDECYVANDDWTDSETMLIADVPPARRASVQKCYRCGRPAVRLDQFWPCHMEMNRCREHLVSAAPVRCLALEGDVA